MSHPFSERRFGTVHVCHAVATDAAAMAALFAEFIPLRAELRFEEGLVEYTGYSRHFLQVPEGLLLPEYEPVFHKAEHNNTPVFLSFLRIVYHDGERIRIRVQQHARLLSFLQRH